jgi:hypothetical protein
MSTNEAPSSLKTIRLALICLTAISIVGVMVTGVVIVKKRESHRPIHLDLVTADTGAKVCINGFSYKLKPSDPDPLFGGGVDVLELEQEPKGEIHFGPDGREYLRRNGPKACALKG